MMARETVPQAMSDAFASATGLLSDRLLDRPRRRRGRGRRRARAPVGGDGDRARRGRAVAAARSTCASRTTTPRWSELRRLLALQRAYDLAGAGDELLAAGRPDDAGELYRKAAELAPASDELLFWSGLAIAQAGDLEGRRGQGPPGDRAQPELAGPARAPVARVRARRRGGPRARSRPSAPRPRAAWPRAASPAWPSARGGRCVLISERDGRDHEHDADHDQRERRSRSPARRSRCPRAPSAARA